jgi:hypothetical protein
VSKAGHVALGINDGTLSIRNAKVLFLYKLESKLSFFPNKGCIIMDLSFKVLSQIR